MVMHKSIFLIIYIQLTNNICASFLIFMTAIIMYTKTRYSQNVSSMIIKC